MEDIDGDAGPCLDRVVVHGDRIFHLLTGLHRVRGIGCRDPKVHLGQRWRSEQQRTDQPSPGAETRPAPALRPHPQCIWIHAQPPIVQHYFGVHFTLIARR